MIGADFLRASLACAQTLQTVPPIADACADIPDADIARMKAIRDAARAKAQAHKSQTAATRRA